MSGIISEEEKEMLRLADDGCPHVDVGAIPQPFVIRSQIAETIASRVKSTPELTYWGETERGYSIYRQANGAGGHRYWSDEIGGGVVIWDTSLASTDSILYAIGLELGIDNPKLAETFRHIADFLAVLAGVKK